MPSKTAMDLEAMRAAAGRLRRENAALQEQLRRVKVQFRFYRTHSQTANVVVASAVRWRRLEVSDEVASQLRELFFRRFVEAVDVFVDGTPQTYLRAIGVTRDAIRGHRVGELRGVGGDNGGCAESVGERVCAGK